jgi:hypothetical protein
VKSSTLDQRVMTGEAAFALGCQRPAHTGEYLILDAVAMLLSSVLNRFAGLELKAAADAVREHWDDWLTLVTKVERFPIRDDPQLFFAVAWLVAPAGSKVAFTPRVVMGERDKIMATLAGEHVYTANFISMRWVLHQLRVNAQYANVQLPERFAIARGEPGYKDWRREINAYRERAVARLQARAKGKGKTKIKRLSRAPALLKA